MQSQILCPMSSLLAIFAEASTARTKMAFVATLPTSIRRQAPQACVTFSPAEYCSRRRSLRVAFESCTLPIDPSRKRDHVFIDADQARLGIADFGECDDDSATRALQDLERPDVPLYTGQATKTLVQRVDSALADAPASAAALTASFDTGSVLRVAWAGACGFVVLRDDGVLMKSYDAEPVSAILNNTLNAPSAGPRVRSEYLLLADGDVVVFGSDGLFSNVSEQQLLAFIRPVPDPHDNVLAMANHTCLGSFQRADPEFLAYYIAHLALNFANATNSRPLLKPPFPPSPHADDVSVVVAVCEFDDG